MRDASGELFLRHDWSGPEVRHLEMIQRRIERLEGQAGQYRLGSPLTFAVVVTAVAISAGTWPLLGGAVVVFVLWGSDAAARESADLHRRFFEAVRDRRGTDFNMTPDGASDGSGRSRAWLWTALTPSVFGVHAPVLLLQVALFLAIEGRVLSLGRGF